MQLNGVTLRNHRAGRGYDGLNPVCTAFNGRCGGYNSNYSGTAAEHSGRAQRPRRKRRRHLQPWNAHDYQQPDRKQRGRPGRRHAGVEQPELEHPPHRLPHARAGPGLPGRQRWQRRQWRQWRRDLQRRRAYPPSARATCSRPDRPASTPETTRSPPASRLTSTATRALRGRPRPARRASTWVRSKPTDRSANQPPTSSSPRTTTPGTASAMRRTVRSEKRSTSIPPTAA